MTELNCCFEGLLNSSVHVERISKIGLGEKNLFRSFRAFRGLVSQKVWELFGLESKF